VGRLEGHLGFYFEVAGFSPKEAPYPCPGRGLLRMDPSDHGEAKDVQNKGMCIHHTGNGLQAGPKCGQEMAED